MLRAAHDRSAKGLLGRGSGFVEAALGPATSPVRWAPGMAHRLLLVEDDDDLRGVMAEGLAADDHVVLEAAGAEAAFELLATAPPDS